MQEFGAWSGPRELGALRREHFDGRRAGLSGVTLVPTSGDCFDLWLEMALPETPGEFRSQSKQVGVSSSSNSVPPSENNMEAKFLGNAPCGHYKFKFPQAMRTESILGAKVFFFKALLLTGDFSEAGKKDRHVWVSKEELGDYLKPKYLAQVRRFLLDL